MLQIFKKKETLPVLSGNAEALVEIHEDESASFEELVEERDEKIEEGKVSDEEASDISNEENPEEPEVGNEIPAPAGFTKEFEENARAYAFGRNVPEGDLNAALAWLEQIGEGWTGANLSMEMLEVVVNGVRYSQDLSDARNEGEIAGRNARIEELYLNPEDSDGLPHISSKGNVSKSSKSAASIFDLARSSRV